MNPEKLRRSLAGLLLFSLVAAVLFPVVGLGQDVGEAISQDESFENVDSTKVEWRYRDHERSAVKLLTLDHAAFRYDQDRIQLELYSTIVRDFLTFVEEKTERGGYDANYEMTFQVLTMDDSLLIESSWPRTSWASDSVSMKSGQRIPELIRYVLYPGTYRIEARVDDLNRHTYYSEDYAIELKPVNVEHLTISDIILASRIERAQGDVAEFDHNGLLVLPNAERVYGDSNPQLFFYTELYNLDADKGGTYTTGGRVLDTNGNEMRTLRERTRQVLGSYLVEVDAFSVATLRSGSYELELQVIDNASQDTAYATRKFWVYRQGEVLTSTQPMGYPGFDISAMTDEDVNQELAWIRPIITDKARAQIQQLTNPDSRRRYLAYFWATNDPDTNTVVNEFRDEYMARLRFVNDRYASFKREGYETDRGRVYLMFGPPDILDDFPYSSNVQRAYQIWYYDSIEGGVQFVFVDRTNLGDFVQVHSTKRGELNNPNWQNTEL